MQPHTVLSGLLAGAALLVASTGMQCNTGMRQVYVSIPGTVEPHTPGAPGVPIPAKLEALLGPDADLNRVPYVRTFRLPQDEPVDAILILIPGFLGGATTFDPIARDLVTAVGSRLEVWAVDRRPNQLEDQLGARHAQIGIGRGQLEALAEGAQFYFPDTDNEPLGDFPGPGDFDVDLDGVLDGQLPLTDAFGATRLPILFDQDDVRFLAHWGIDLYMRDWKLLVDAARAKVGPDGVVLIGGHSQGTTWASIFTAYDFDPGPGVVSGHSLVDGLILLEGGGVRPPSGTPPTQQEYLDAVAALEQPGGPTNFMESLVIGGAPVLALKDLGTVGQVASMAGFFDPDAPSLIQRTPVFDPAASLIGLLLSSPATNQAIAGMFLDDDFSANPAFRAAMGFTDNGPNFLSSGIYRALPATSGGAYRTWKHFDDPTLPVCPPHLRNENNLFGSGLHGIGCAINLTANPGDREVSDLNSFLRAQFEVNNGFEWYFLDGHVSLDFAYGNNSSSLGDESLLAITQNAGMNKPVLGIGGGNGLTPTVTAYNTYFNSIATAAGNKKAFILPGYAHVDPLIAHTNEAVPLIVNFLQQIEAGANPVFP
jgi:hypothetical protein